MTTGVPFVTGGGGMLLTAANVATVAFTVTVKGVLLVVPGVHGWGGNGMTLHCVSATLSRTVTVPVWDTAGGDGGVCTTLTERLAPEPRNAKLICGVRAALVELVTDALTESP